MTSTRSRETAAPDTGPTIVQPAPEEDAHALALPHEHMPGAELRYVPDFLDHDRADHFFRSLLQDIAWREEQVFIWGKWRMQPRLVAWYGDPEAVYTYSGRRHEPLPWSPLLEELRALVEARTGARFNSVLLNLYRDQRDSMGWHRDNESELGVQPTIASLSLGECRQFLLKSRSDKSAAIRRLPLAHGSLLVMAGSTQQHCLHALAKERRPCGARINLTFRRIFAKQPARTVA